MGVRIDGGFDAHVLPERGLDVGPGGVGHQVHVDDPVRPLVDAEDHVLEVLGSPSTLDVSGFPKLGTLAGSAVLEARPEVGLVDLDLSVQQSDGLVLEGPDRTPEPEEEAVDPMAGHLHPPGDVMVGQSELKREEQLVDLRQGEPGANQPGAAEQAECFPHRLHAQRPSERPALPRVAARDDRVWSSPGFVGGKRVEFGVTSTRLLRPRRVA